MLWFQCLAGFGAEGSRFKEERRAKCVGVCVGRMGAGASSAQLLVVRTFGDP